MVLKFPKKQATIHPTAHENYKQYIKIFKKPQKSNQATAKKTLTLDQTDIPRKRHEKFKINP